MVSSVSVLAATRLASGMYLDTFDTYADLTFLFLSEVYDFLRVVVANGFLGGQKRALLPYGGNFLAWQFCRFRP